jgi:hypothetical protein
MRANALSLTLRKTIPQYTSLVGVSSEGREFSVGFLEAIEFTKELQ